MIDQQRQPSAAAAFSARTVTLCALALVSLAASCFPPAPRPGQVCFQAWVAYYYKYKQANPNESDIVFVEAVPAGTRCVKASAKTPPVFPDAAVIPAVAAGSMTIGKMQPQVVNIAGKADIAVYYGEDADTTKPPGPHPVLAVEDLTGVSRSIQTFSVKDSTEPPHPACPPCPSGYCGQYACCRPC